MKKEIKFEKGVFVIDFPFLINDLSPWQEQIKIEMQRMIDKYKVRKSARWGFSITESCAEIKCYKN
jgi:hypothetical protein